MDPKVFIVLKLPDSRRDFGDSFAAAVRHQQFPISLNVRDANKPVGPDNFKLLLIDRITRLETTSRLGRFYISGMTGKCEVSPGGEHVTGWLNDLESSGELLVSQSPFT